MQSKPALQDARVHVRTKIAALWVSATLCYLYGDIIGLYKPGAIQSMLDGNMGFWGPLPQSQGVLLFIAVAMTPSCVLVALTFLLGPRPCRWLNVVFGVLYTALVLIIIPTAFDLYFFEFLSIVEVVLTSAIVWYALTWPKEPAHE